MSTTDRDCCDDDCKHSAACDARVAEDVRAIFKRVSDEHKQVRQFYRPKELPKRGECDHYVYSDDYDGHRCLKCGHACTCNARPILELIGGWGGCKLHPPQFTY